MAVLGISIFFAAIAAPAASVGTTFVCETDTGASFSVFVPEGSSLRPMSNSGEQLYRATGLAGAEDVDAVIDTLPDNLTLIWRGEEEGEITLDIIRYDAEAGTARFRIRRESPPDAPIVTVTASDGFCSSLMVDDSVMASQLRIDE